MLTLNDGRSELWQWDTGRELTVDADCSQVHFSNKVFGRSIDVDVVDGVAIIPDILLQTDKDLTAWAFVGTAKNGYTKIRKVFNVNRRNKPADYVFTPPEQATLGQIMERLDDLEAMKDPNAIKNAVDEYLANNPIQIDEKDPTVHDWAKQTKKPKYTATEVGAVATVNGVKPDANGNVVINVSGGGASISIGSEKPTDGSLYWLDTSEDIPVVPDEPVIPDVPDEPDEPDVPEKTLTSISAVYSGGDVAVGTAVSDLTGIVVTATYSDGSTATVTGYTLSGTIAEGSNTVTVTYQGTTTTFTVTGVAESGGETGGVYLIKDVADEVHSGQTFSAGVNANGEWEESFYNDTTITCYKISNVRAGDTIVNVVHNNDLVGFAKNGEENAVKITGEKAFIDNYACCLVTWTADQDYDVMYVNATTAKLEKYSDYLTWTKAG